MGFIEFLLLVAVAYLVWRISDQLPDLLFRISEIQRDVADIRKRLIEANETTETAKPARKKPAKKSAAATKSAADKSVAAKSATRKSTAKTEDNSNTDEQSG